MTKTLVEQYVEDPMHMRVFQQERALYEVTDLIERVMAEQGITRSQLAAKLGRTKGWVTQLLDGDRNKTIRTVADVFAVLGREFCAFQRPIQIQTGKKNSSVDRRGSRRRSRNTDVTTNHRKSTALDRSRARTNGLRR
jgi:transcriptional regulator with XRE-family HTH domain